MIDMFILTSRLMRWHLGKLLASSFHRSSLRHMLLFIRRTSTNCELSWILQHARFRQKVESWSPPVLQLLTASLLVFSMAPLPLVCGVQVLADLHAVASLLTGCGEEPLLGLGLACTLRRIRTGFPSLVDGEGPLTDATDSEAAGLDQLKKAFSSSSQSWRPLTSKHSPSSSSWWQAPQLQEFLDPTITSSFRRSSWHGSIWLTWRLRIFNARCLHGLRRFNGWSCHAPVASILLAWRETNEALFGAEMCKQMAEMPRFAESQL